MIASVLWRLVAVLQVARISFAAASVLPGRPHRPAALTTRQTDPDQFDYSLCQASCELGSCGAGGSCPAGGGLFRRDVDDSGLFFNASRDPAEVHTGSLARRLFTWDANSQNPPGSGVKNPTRNQANAYHVAVHNGGAQYYGPALRLADFQNERPISQLKTFGTEPFQILSSGLVGCTAIVVASTRGVWMTHLWESYSNGKWFDEEGNGHNFVHKGDPAFNQRVLMFLRGQTVTDPLPNGWRPYVQPEGPGIDKTLFNNKATDQTQVFVITPVLPNTDKRDMDNDQYLKYKLRYGPGGEVHDTIRDILGPDINPRYQAKGYLPLNMADDAQRALIYTNARGSVLFQYDSNSDGEGKRRWRLLVEDRGLIYKNLPALT